MKKNNCNKTSIGGQAVIEGVMMKGKTSYATAVRSESGEILVESKRLKTSSKSFVKKTPILRGVFAFFDSLVGGTKVLSRSATVFGEDESSSFDKFNTLLFGISYIFALIKQSLIVCPCAPAFI